MRLRFLGTSAGELYPGIWCCCRNCQAARAGSPKDRRQSATLYVAPSGDASTESLLIDFPSEIADQVIRYRVDLKSLSHLLITHSHGDHWFPYLLRWRRRPQDITFTPPIHIGGPRFTELPRLHVYGNAAVEQILHRELGEDLSPFDLEYHRTVAGDRFAAGGWMVTALLANHDVGQEEALHYVIEGDGATLLYGLDGDTFLPETRAALRSFRFDLVVLESTYGYGDGRNHRNFARVEAEADWLRNDGLLMPSGRIMATHFSPHHCPPHAETSAYLAARQILAAWDGLEITLPGP
jgi:phosphoribosyl 1,2-cyclic phosphate phosphodiesterase